MIIVFIVVCVATFFSGFVLGLFGSSRNKTTVERSKPQDPDTELERIRHEYQNFLSYDGSEQS